MQAGGENFVLLEIRGHEVVLKSERSNDMRVISEADLIRDLLDGTVQTRAVAPRRSVVEKGTTLLSKADVQRASPKAIEVASAKAQWLNALQRHGIDRVEDKPWVRTLIRRLATGELKDVRAFKINTLIDAQQVLENSDGDVVSLLPQFAARGAPGVMRIDARAQEIIQTVIKNKVASGQRIEPSDLIREVTADIISHNGASPENPISPPGASTIRRMIAREVPAYVMTRSKVGARQANLEFREHAHAREQTRRPLQISEWDDVDTGVFLIEERSSLPWGRGWLTHGIDVHTRVPLGYYLGDHKRCFESMMGAICHGLLPKPFDKDTGHWIGYGTPSQIVLDNARYNHCVAAKHQAGAMGLLLSATRPRGPTEKTRNEYFNHLLKIGLSRYLPGWKGDGKSRAAVDEGVSGAVLTVQQFQRAFETWVCRDYLNMPGEDGLTPKQRWQSYYKSFGPAVRYSSEQLALFQLVPAFSTFRESGGLLRMSLRYASNELAALRRHLGKTAKVPCYVNRFDLSYLMVENPFTKQLIRVESSEDPKLVKGLTERQQKWILAICRQKKQTNPSIVQQVEARAVIQRIVADAMRSKKMKERARAMQYGSLPGSQDDTKMQERAASSDPPQLMSELEYEMSQLDLVAQKILGESDEEAIW